MVTVIMGIYNCADTLAEALDSLLVQTYQDFRVVMCDDGSTDNTYHVANEYVTRHPEKFVLLKNDTNKGLNHTLNRCLEIADTKYVARMDGDDISLPERFAKEVEFLEAHPEIAIVSTPMVYFDEEGDFREGKNRGVYIQPIDFLRGTPFSHGPCMVRREAMMAVRGYSESPEHQRVEDYHLWFKMYAAGYRGYILKEPLYRMRDNRHAIRRRSWKNRVNEYKVRREGYAMLNLPCIKRLWMFQPLIVGLVPSPLYKLLHRLG